MATLRQLRAELPRVEERADETITFIEKLNIFSRKVKRSSAKRKLASLRRRMMAHAEKEMTRRNTIIKKIKSVEKKGATRRSR